MQLPSADSAWHLFGAAGGLVFYGRFYVQWLVSEAKKKSVIPIAFWYMSGAGSLMQFVYAVHLRSPGMAFGQCFNVIVYSRNLVHIWRERGVLTAALNIGVHALAGLAVLVAMVFTALTWRAEFVVNQSLAPGQAARNWLWLGVWACGQALFFSRFLIQWAATEIKKKSVVPPIFWYISVVAASLQGASFVQRRDWIFAIGMAATIAIYARNIMFLARHRHTSSSSSSNHR